MPAAFHEPNPLDLLFHAAALGLRQSGLPGHPIYSIWELAGKLDLPRLHAAIHATVAQYPVLSARRVLHWPTGRHRWRIPAVPDDARAFLTLHRAANVDSGPTTRIEPLLTKPIAERARPPFEIHVFAAEENDVLVARWPHDLMDARAGWR